jgi:hypothetical protein
MRKRIIFGILAGAMIITASVFYFIKENEHIVDSIYRAVPLDAALIVDFKNFEEFYNNMVSGNQFWNEISAFPVFNTFNRQLRSIDSLRKTNPSINALLSQDHSILISGHPMGKDEIQLVYYFKINAESDFRQIDKLIQSYESNTIDYSSHNYEHSTIRDIIFAEKKGENFSYTWSHGLMILSKSSILVEDAVRQLLAKESILELKGLKDIIKTAGKTAVANFYFNFDFLPRISQKIIHSKFNHELKFLKSFANWIELDLNVKPGMLILNGFSYGNVYEPGFESLFRNQKPQKLEIFNKIPSQSNTFAVLGISNFGQYQKDYQLFLEKHENAPNREANLQALKDKYNIDLLKSFHDVFEQEAGIVFANLTDDTLANQAFSIIRTKSKDDAENLLNSFITEYANKNNLQTNSMVSEKAIDKDLKTKFWNLPIGNIPALLFGQLFSVNDNQFCTLLNNYIIFGSSVESLVKYSQNLMQGTPIENDLEFNNFSEYFASQSNFFFYNKPALSANFYPNFIKQDVNAHTAKNGDLSKIQAFVYQFNISDNNLIYNNIFIKYNSENISNNAKTTWESPLDASPIGKPFILKSNGNNPDIIVYDAKNQIYLVNNMGRIVWKVKLPEPIISDIYQLDYYKNGKFQILFNTRTRIYMLDRKGNAVESFPVTLKVPATNGLALFDYDKNHNYRIFVAGNDHKIYGYDKDGKIIEGWENKQTESDITQPLQHFNIENKDFLVFNDSYQLYAVDRKGKEILKTSKNIPISINNKTALINARSLLEARFLLTDTSGKVYSIATDGSMKATDYGKYPGKHWFDVYDINGDGIKDFIFSWGNTLKAVSQKNKEFFTVTTENGISFRPTFYEFPQRKYKIGLVTSDNEKIFLYDGTGILFKGFPLKGKTQFSIEQLNNSENRFNLMVGSNNNFLYYYSVQ